MMMQQPAKKYKISHARIFADFTGEFVDNLKRKSKSGKHSSVMAAFGEIYGAQGKEVTDKLREIDNLINKVKAAKDVVGALEKGLEEAEEQNAEEDTLAATKAKIEKAELEVDEAETALGVVKEDLLKSIEACGGQQIEKSELTVDVMRVLNYAAFLFDANKSAGAMVAIQLPRAVPGAPAELEMLAIRILAESMTDIAKEAMPKIGITVKDGALALEITAPDKDGVKFDGATVKRVVWGKVKALFKKVMHTVTSLGSIVTESSTQSEIVSAMAEAVSKSTGHPLGPYTLK
jgi:hypothetical protein